MARRMPQYTVPRQEMIRRNKEVIPWLRENAYGVFLDDMVSILEKRFGYEYTKGQLTSLYRRARIEAGTKGKIRGTHFNEQISKEMKAFIKENRYKFDNDAMFEKLKEFPGGEKLKRTALVRYRRKTGTTFRKYTPEMHEFAKAWCRENHCARYEELAKAMNEKFGTNLTRRLVAGFVSYNKYSTNHYKAHRTARQKPLNSERWRRSHQGEAGYWEVKVAEPNVWRPKSCILWEQYHNKKVPEDGMIVYLDGDHNNFAQDNLLLVSRRVMGVVNSRYKLTKGNKELSRLAYALGELDLATCDAEQGNR